MWFLKFCGVDIFSPFGELWRHQHTIASHFFRGLESGVSM